MSRFRRHSRHSRKKRAGSSLYIIVLFLLAMAVIWVLTADFESSTAFKWMTGTQQSATIKNVEVKVFDSGQFGVLPGDSIPRWIATKPSELTQDSPRIFFNSQFGKSYNLDLTHEQIPLWNDYVRHVQFWAAECDTLYLIYGPVPDSSARYMINLCIEENSHGQGIVIPSTVSELPFFNFSHSIDAIERLTRIDFFADLLDEESEAYIEKYHQRFRWIYPEDFYNHRIEQNKLIQDGN